MSSKPLAACVGLTATALDSLCGALVRAATRGVRVPRAANDLRGPDGQSLRLRIGIYAGAVVAGVIGERKFAYDLWGDTVNTASRMEFHGVPGRVQVTAGVAARLRDEFHVEERGLTEVKGKGAMQTYWLLSRKP